MSSHWASLPPQPTPVAVPPEPSPWARERRTAQQHARSDQRHPRTCSDDSDDLTEQWREFLFAGSLVTSA